MIGTDVWYDTSHYTGLYVAKPEGVFHWRPSWKQRLTLRNVRDRLLVGERDAWEGILGYVEGLIQRLLEREREA